MIAHLAGDGKRRSSRSVGRDARPSGSRSSASTAACSPAPSSPPIYGSIAGRLFGSSGPCRSEGWRPTRHWKAGKSAGSAGAGSTARSAPRTSATAGSLPMKCSCGACSRSITCSSTPACRGSPPSRRRSARSRRSASSAGSCPRGSTGEPPGTRGAISRSSCRSRSKPSAPCSSTSIPDTIPRRRSAPGPWHIAASGKALRERGRSIEVVAVVRTVRELQRALTILENWTNTSTASGPSAVPEPDSAARREIARIEQAIRKKDDRVLKEYGDLQACLKRIVELNDVHRSSSPGTLIHGFATWRSRRLPGGGF